jgi:hypothetical protein
MKEAMKMALETFKEIADQTYDSWTNGAKAQRIAQAMIPKLEEALKQEHTKTNQVTLTQTNVGIGERGMEAYAAAKERGWVGVSDEQKQEHVAPVADLSRLKPENAQQMREWIADGSFVQRAIDTMFDLSQEITALKQEQGEPVAWTLLLVGEHNGIVGKAGHTFENHPEHYSRVDVYTAPQQRKPLTDEQILNSARDHYNSHQRAEISFARAIEAAHGIKENT